MDGSTEGAPRVNPEIAMGAKVDQAPLVHQEGPMAVRGDVGCTMGKAAVITALANTVGLRMVSRTTRP